ncbi:MAG: hypothetical protein ACREM8_11680 [Vulcanimicrobiaceae bacterium]
MVRGLILGAVAFGAIFFAERQFEHVKKDLDRYDSLRAMSGDEPFLKEQLNNLLGMFGSFGSARQSQAMGLFDSLQGDLMRYARLRGM